MVCSPGRFVDNTRILIDLVDGQLTFTPTEPMVGSADVEIRPIGAQPVQSSGDGPVVRVGDGLSRRAILGCWAGPVS
ncbi:MAG: hypothetical protein KatS3mg052_0967 [Candidatus Roseilinea sp.]|nr:MAG: hypothetical protein KatS3mg052_0967 [Candidatus Roseilinea sp.]